MSDPIWNPSAERIAQANMTRFMDQANQEHGLSLQSYEDMHKWSVENIADFWALAWGFLEIKASKPYEQVLDAPGKMPGARWFEGAELNFAENLLRYADDQPAIIFQGEKDGPRTITYAELSREVGRLARALRRAGVEKGDRVAGFMPNLPETAMAMLAATSLGAVWSSCSPDFGIQGVLDRFGQIEPKVLFSADGYHYSGKTFDSLSRVQGILNDLPSVQKLVVVPFTSGEPDISGMPRAQLWADFMTGGGEGELEFTQVTAGHPLYVMYSSGTTGKPKCMVQSVAGVLLNQLKEMVLHTDLKRNDRIFYFTTCGWMMWNWLMSALAVGATLVLYDGSPFYPGPDVLWKMAQDLGITVFGASARYIAALEQAGVKPEQGFDLSSLRTVLSTGSPLMPENFDYVYQDIKEDLQLCSISGGTDINGCFALGNPIGPVYRGELQCRGLGLKVLAYNDEGEPVYDEQGELVCAAAFPSMPIYFWDDLDNKKYLDAYFERFPGVWCHGDFISINSETGGVVISGRSDATLNPGGVRIGTADIYSVVEGLPEVADSIVVGQNWDNDVRIVLFVKLVDGVDLDEALVKKIKGEVRTSCSPRHVPAKVIPVTDIPYTINLKKVELAVRNVIHDRPVTNKDAMANPEALDLYADLVELKS